MEVDDEKRIVHIGLHISERLSGPACDDRDDLVFDIPFRLEAPWAAFDVRWATGSQLIIGQRSCAPEVNFLLGNPDYFSSARSTIAFNRANYAVDHSNPHGRTWSDNLPDVFASFVAEVSGQPDNVFAGNVAGFAWTLRPPRNAHQNIRALCDLMSNPNFPTKGLEQIGQGIFPFLNPDSGLSEEDRDAVVKMLVRLSAGIRKVPASEGLRLIGALFAEDRLQIRKYIDKSSASKVIRNIQDFQFDRTAHFSELVKELQKIN